MLSSRIIFLSTVFVFQLFLPVRRSTYRSPTIASMQDFMRSLPINLLIYNIIIQPFILLYVPHLSSLHSSSIYLSIYPSTHPLFYLFNPSPSVYPTIHPSIYPPSHPPSIHPPTTSSTHQSTNLHSTHPQRQPETSWTWRCCCCWGAQCIASTRAPTSK